MTLAVRKATAEDAAILAPLLRKEDKDEIAAASGVHPAAALLLGISLGPTWVAEDSKGPVIIWGVAPSPINSEIGHPWMVGTDRLKDHSVQFARNCRAWVKKLGDGYKVLHNTVDARNTLHLRWLQWCGFKFIARHERAGAEGRPFFEFCKNV